MDACTLANVMAWLMIVTGAATIFFLSSGFCAPYGRHKHGLYSVEIPGRLAWLTQEVPCFLLPLIMYKQHGSTQKLPLMLLVLHYLYRSCVYPFWLEKPKASPVHVWGAAVAFVLYNSVLQVILGTAIWAAGLSVNIKCDVQLQKLRKQRPDKDYQVPYGGLYNLVSCPNYLAETVEWIGYAVVSGSWASTAFAWYTFANLAPRAQQHHLWYKEQFANYPKDRKAYVPYLW